MQRDEYDGWAERYADTFGLNHEAGLKMLNGWYVGFAAAGYTVAELDRAAVAVAKNPPRADVFRWQDAHLGRIHDAVRAERLAARAAEERAQAFERGDVCGASEFRQKLQAAADAGNLFARWWLSANRGRAGAAAALGDAWEGA